MLSEYLGKSNKRMKKIHTLTDIVKAMDDAEGHDDLTFDSKHRDFLEFIQTAYENVGEEALMYASMGGVRQRMDFARQFLIERRIQDINYGLGHLNDIVNDLESEDKLKNVAINYVPIKDTDLEKANDLDGLIQNYEDTIETLEENLEDINQETHPDEYNAQQRTINEYKEFKSLLEDYKPLVREIVEFKRVYTPLIGQRGRPDNESMKRIFDEYLDELAKRYKDDDEDKYKDSIALIKSAKVLSSNPHYLGGYYIEGVINPAQEKVFEAAKGTNLKDYTKRIVGVIDNTQQMQFLDTVYTASTQKKAA